MLTAVVRTHPGAVRTNNEDVGLCDPDLGLLALADGMGGHNAGEVAARLAVDAVHGVLRDSAAGGTALWPVPFDDAASLAANRVRAAMVLAGRRVFRASQETPEYAGMGTTLTMAVVEGGRLTYSSVGDSRLYLFRDSRLRQMTRDDSMVNAVADVAGVDPALLGRHSLGHLLTKALGPAADIDAAVEEAELADGDLLLLSSDGLHGGVSPLLIQAILQAGSDLARAADRLVRAALEADGRDNITVVLARYTA